MIISHKHKFIFFKTRKTAGSSIQVALAEQCGPEDIITGQYRLGVDDNSHTAGLNMDKFFTNHPHPELKQVKAFLGEEIWNSYFKFAFVRNPFDIAVSRYHWNVKGKLGKTETSIKDFQSWVSSGKLLREDSAKLYIAENNNIALDFVGRYENLQEDLNFICKKLNLNEINLPNLKSGFRDNTSYTKFYNDEVKSTVSEFYKEDFNLLNYSFYPRFKLEKYKQPLISASEIKDNNVNGPSVIKVPDFVKNKLGKYYMYFAHHAGDHIRLTYADKVEGPWTLYKPGAHKLSNTSCRNHIASPDVHVRDGKIVMYYHGDHFKGQSTFVAESEDGIKFVNKKGPITPFYHREFDYLGQTYAICKNKNINSQIFKKVDQEYKPEFEFLPKSRHTAVYVDGKDLFIFYTVVEEAPERIYVMRIHNWEVVDNYELTRPDLSFEGADQPLTPSRFGMAHGFSNQLRDPCTFVDEDRLYLFYSYGGESGITFGELT